MEPKQGKQDKSLPANWLERQEGHAYDCNQREAGQCSPCQGQMLLRMFFDFHTRLILGAHHKGGTKNALVCIREK